MRRLIFRKGGDVVSRFFLVCVVMLGVCEARGEKVVGGVVNRYESEVGKKGKVEAVRWVRLHKAGDEGKYVEGVVERVRGWDEVVLRGRRNERVVVKWGQIAEEDRVKLDRYVVRGRVERWEIARDFEEKLARVGMKSWRYWRNPAGGNDASLAVRERRVRKLPFLMYEPENGLGRDLPVILFLHGNGGGGRDGRRAFEEDGGGGAKHFLHLCGRDWQKYMPCYVIVPQSWMKSVWWYDGVHEGEHYPSRMALQLVEVLKGRYGKKMDLSRVYVTGLSAGGFGCYQMEMASPGKLAGVVPLASYNDELRWFRPEMAVPTYVFINRGDASIAWKYVDAERDLWKKWGREWRIRVYESGGHDVWSRAYGEGDFRKWLQRQKLPFVTWPSDPSVWVTDEQEEVWKKGQKWLIEK